MKVYTFLLICILTILSFGCSMVNSFDNFTKSNKSSSPADYDQQILQVITEARGSVYPKEGDILQMRLFESGRFEYDDFPDYNPPKFTSRNVSVTRKEAKLSPEDVKELISLAEQPDFLSAKEYYPTLHQHTDTSWITKINFTYKDKEKRIVAINFWDTQYYKEDKSKYPPSMVELLERVEELKAKAVGKSSTQWLNIPSGRSANMNEH